MSKKNKLKVIYFQKDMPTQPLFKVGDSVSHSKDLCGLIESVVTEIHREYQVVDSNGKFDWNGLCTLEDTIDSCSLPWSFDGKILKVWFPRTDYGDWIQKAYISESHFSGYSYTTKNKEMNTIWSETSLKLI